MNTQPTVADIAISTSAVSPDDLPAAFVARYTLWLNAGYTPDFAQLALNGDFEDVANREAAKHDQTFETALLVEDWKANPDLRGEAGFVSGVERVHAQSLYFAGKTSFPDVNRGDDIPYMRGVELVRTERVEIPEKDLVLITVVIRSFDNSDDNNVGESLTNGTSISTDEHTMTWLFDVSDGTYRLTDYLLVS